ncbi:response regulator transcription factor [Paenibacillus sp. RC67]|uniref:response regulator transcription factor n=1 Tax=Paenibacillus sp. RC67 TaxID=3039392 RepID=UPI0024ADEB59|nr:response regulator transcription factor [Paenibacillus sp. RC67]
MSYNLLIVEDEPEIIELLRLYLEKEYCVFEANNGEQALLQVNNHKIDLAILDIMMPDMDGFQLIKKIREAYQFPVLFLSARSQDYDKILGLSLGADDYITKPFNPLEIVARVQALLRRVHQFDSTGSIQEEEEQLIAGDLMVDTKSCTVYQHGQPVSLTSTEYKIIALMMAHPGRVLTRRRIYEAVWDDMFAYDDNTIMVHISNLREKIEKDPRHPEYIKTIRGLGYKFETPMEI